MADRDLVPYEVTRTWTVLAAAPADAANRARPGEHHDVDIVRMPCKDWPAPCTHDPAHVRPGDVGLPSTAQIRAWLLTHDWELVSSGLAGTLWHLRRSGEPCVGVPDDDDDPALTAGALERIASRSHLSLDSLTREMGRLLHG